MKLPSPPLAVLAAALLSCLVVIPFLPFNGPERRPFAFELEFVTDTTGYAQVYFDIGTGYNEANTTRFTVPRGESPTRIRFGLPSGTYRSFRFDPTDRRARVSFRGARIVDEEGTVLHTFAATDFTPQQQIDRHEVDGDLVSIETAAHANDPIMALALAQPLTLRSSPILMAVPGRALPVFGVICGLLLISRLFPSATREMIAARAASWREKLRARPVRAVVAVAALAAILSSYPVVFLGKSFISPSFSDGTFLLYEQFPTLPGFSEKHLEDAKGSDVGAITWQHVPYSFVQSDALLRDGELPLWNRYNSCGTVLLGQGQSMFGDPLQVLVLLTRGAAWSWDLKYLLAKWLLCCGVGLSVLHCTRHLPSATLTAISAAFVGFFIYRVNHPAFFSFCYSPWILYTWLRIVDAPTVRTLAFGCFALIVANVAEMHSGTAKEAYMLLLSLNLAGVLALIGAAQSVRAKVLRLAAATWAGVVFVLLTAPSWMTFLTALGQSFTSYNSNAAFQILPTVALGFFDEIFYRPLMRGEMVSNPSANFVVLAGLLYFVAAFAPASKQPHARGLVWSTVLPVLLAFGVMPPQWIVKIPFLGNVHHIDNSFSCVLIILALVLAGFGWRAAFERLGSAAGWSDLKRLILLLALLVGSWIAFTQTVHRPTFGEGSVVSVLTWGQQLPVNNFLWGYLAVLVFALLLLLWSIRRGLRLQRFDTAGILLISAALVAMLWRPAAHASAVGPAGYVFTPMSRPDFAAKSEAIEAIKKDQIGPARVVGFGGNLFPGWSSAYRIEGINGPDALMNPYYRELVVALGLEQIWGWRLYTTNENIASSKAALDFLNVRHYVDLHSDRARMSQLLTPLVSADLDVYRSETAWPRAFFANSIVPYETTPQLVQHIAAADGKPFAALLPAEQALLQQSVSVSTAEPAAAQIIPGRDYHLTTNTTEFTVDATAPGIVVLQETWLPRSFRATVNGARAAVVRVNHAFKGVPVSAAGTYRISITYRPPNFVLALSLSAVGVALLAISTLWAGRSDRRLA